MGEDEEMEVEPDLEEDVQGSDDDVGAQAMEEDEDRVDDPGSDADEEEGEEDQGKPGKGQQGRNRGTAKAKGKAKGKAAGQGRASAKYKAGPGRQKTEHGATRQCQACFKHRDADQFPPGSRYELQCKRALDVVYKACERQGQGQLDWYYEQTSKQESMKSLMTHYFRLHPVNKKTGRRANIKLLSLKESFVVSTMVDRDDVGEMMHVDAFVHWAKKPKNWGLSEVDAKQKFKELCRAPGAHTLIFL